MSNPKAKRIKYNRLIQVMYEGLVEIWILDKMDASYFFMKKN